MTRYSKIGLNRGKARFWLEGKVLTEAGFTHRAQFTATCEPGRITIELDAAGKRHVAGKPDRLVIDLISADVATVAPIGTRMMVRNTKPGRLICTIAIPSAFFLAQRLDTIN